MKTLPVALAPSSARSSLLAAYNQWSHANFSGCLDELDRLEATVDPTERVEARILRARVFTRLDQPLEALAVLDSTETDVRHDVGLLCSVKSVRGHALALEGRHDEAIPILESAVAQSRCGVPRSVHLEAVYMLAFARWLNEEYEKADALAVQAAEPSGDIIGARAVALRGWIAVGQARYARALDFFRDSARIYGSALARDAGFAASTLHAIAMYELELLQSAESPRYYQGDFPTVPGPELDTFRLLVHDVDAWRAALAGDEHRAIESSARMTLLMLSPHWRVFRSAACAMIAEAFGHLCFSRGFAGAGLMDAHDLDWNQSPAESRMGLPYLAEALASHDVDQARAVLKKFSGIRSIVSARFFRGKTKVQRAAEELSRGVVALRGKDERAARVHLQSAYQIYADLGFGRNALTAQLLLGEDDSAEGQRHYRTARAIILERFPRSYLARRLNGFSPSRLPETPFALTPAQRYIVSALCAGLTPRQIARKRGTSVGTIYNQMKEIYRRTGVHSIQGIVTRFAATA